MVLLEGYANYSPSAGLDDIAADDGILGPVGAFDEYIGLKRSDQIVGCLFIKDHDTVHGGQRLQDLGALGLRCDRPVWSLVHPHRPIGIDSDEQGVSKTTRLSQVTDVTRMEQIKNAIRENDGLSGGAPFGNKADGLVERHVSVLTRTLGENVHVCFGR